MAAEKVLDFRKSRKVSFDGKYYLTRLPPEIIEYLKQKGAVVNETLVDGIWKLKEKTFGVLLVFSEGSEQKETPKKAEPPGEKEKSPRPIEGDESVSPEERGWQYRYGRGGWRFSKRKEDNETEEL